MADLVECVPNFSEGRRMAVVDELAGAVRGVPEVVLLDRTSDPDHNRSVLTFAGPVGAVASAMQAAVDVALERIDMETHVGQHPRMGAVDVVPFVPLGESSMELCVELARSFGRTIAERFELPVYLYGRAATRPERILLSDVRKPQYEGLKKLITEPGWVPDFGPRRLHPRGGATAVGARPFLIAYNINLESADVSIARRIARDVRESSGGLARVQALGLFLDDLRCAQVSMNLLDHTVTSMWRVWETVQELAHAEGVTLRESELIGLAPLAALIEVAEHAGVPDGPDVAARITAGAASLRIRDFDPLMALELRLAAANRLARRGSLMSSRHGASADQDTGVDPEAVAMLVTGAAEVVTLAGGIRRGASQGEPAVLRAGDGGRRDEVPSRSTSDLAVGVIGERIVGVGRRDEVERALERVGVPADRLALLDARGGTITPGLIDPHTHLLFAGTRERELRMRQQGARYLDILAAGGGILATVRATRVASDDDLMAHGRRWLGEMLRHGVTTIEAKSGYGLDRATELRLLEVLGRLAAEGPVDIVPTYLGAHAVAPEARDRADPAEAHVRDVIEVQLPAIAEQGIARSCDVFCEAGVFTADQSRRVLEAAVRLGLPPRLHADELHPSGGAELAASLGALSADHLAAPSQEGIDALAAAADRGRPVVATLLPATSFYLLSDRYAPARTLIDRGVPIALGTDFNPGTAPVADLRLVLSIACLQLALDAAEALAAVTINAAAALDIAETRGSLEPGKQADLVVWDVASHEQLPYWIGADLVRAVVKRGKVVHVRDADRVAHPS